MSERNGHAWTDRIINGLLAVVIILLSWWATGLAKDIAELKEFKSQVEKDINETKWTQVDMRRDMCRFERKLDDLTEFVTKKTVYRTPCP